MIYYHNTKANTYNLYLYFIFIYFLPSNLDKNSNNNIQIIFIIFKKFDKNLTLIYIINKYMLNAYITNII